MTDLQIKIIAAKKEIRACTSPRRRRDLEKYVKRLEREQMKVVDYGKATGRNRREGFQEPVRDLLHAR